MFERIQAAGRKWGAVAALCLAGWVYFYGLDGLHIPRNGDEDVYARITRLTGEAGGWLPLRSDLIDMRNTKPPLLFWQGIVASARGDYWDRWHLRLPSVVYTLLTAGLLHLLGRRLTQAGGGEQGNRVGAIAALTYLAFFSTYRYGRPFLVNPAETFWLFLPFFTLLYWRNAAFASRLAVPLGLGLVVGVGLLYKSFALLAPVGLVLTMWHLQARDFRWREFWREDVLKLVLTGAVALGLFALWFVFDPDPQAVWREFVVGENAGKFGAADGSYWQGLLWGGGSLWALLLGYPMNAGLLFFPVAALFFVAWRRRREMDKTEKMLWLWLLVFLVIFAVPRQRSARYLLEAMPALALLCALNWTRIFRAAFVASLTAAGVALFVLGWLAFHLQQEIPALYGPVFWAALVGTGALILLAALKPAWTRALTLGVALLTLWVAALFLRPFDGPLGRFDAAAQAAAKGEVVWTPCNFRADDEGQRFLLPGARIRGYQDNWNLSLADLQARYALFAVRLPLHEKPCADCQVLGQRLEIRSRHTPDELKAMLRGEVMAQLFVREWLLRSPAAIHSVRQEAGCL